MRKGFYKIVLIIIFHVAYCGFAYTQEVVLKSPIYDSDMLQSGRLNTALSGLTEVDFLDVRDRLLTLQSNIKYYPKGQQAQYWYYLAVSSWRLGLSSEQVIPNIEKSLSFRDAIDDYELYQILMNAKDMARDYVHFHHAINYINQIRQIVGERPDSQGLLTVSPVDADYAIAHYEIGESKKAIGYLNTLIAHTEDAGDKPVRYWFQVLSSAQVNIGDIAGAIITLKKLIALYPHRNSIEYLEVLESNLANTFE